MCTALNFFILLSFLFTCFELEWLKLPLWVHVAARGHKFPSVALSLRLWPSKWQLQAGQKGPDNTPGFVRLRLEPCPSVTEAAAVGSYQHETRVSSRGVRGAVAPELSVNTASCYGCLSFLSAQRRSYEALWGSNMQWFIWCPTWGLLLVLPSGESLGCCILQMVRMAGPYSIYLLPCHVTNAQDRKDLEWRFVGYRKQKTCVSFETNAPSIYKTGPFVKPTRRSLSQFVSSFPYCIFCLSLLFVLGNVQITSAR